MRKIILVIIFLNGCSSTDIGFFKDQKKYINDKNNDKINFDDDYTVDEYMSLLEKYSKDSDYPNMNK
tara:strand:- start:339 stop:539 length:201 start_codon:yes stop_codon:yes gene_type:complete